MIYDMCICIFCIAVYVKNILNIIDILVPGPVILQNKFQSSN